MLSNLFKEAIVKFFIREPIKKKYRIRWWLVYGPPRTGTSYITNLISSRSKLFIQDWGLRRILSLPPNLNYIKFDGDRFLRDVSNNILDNAYMHLQKQEILESIFKKTKYIDLVFKQAGLDSETYNILVKMWGKPERKIFCFREPAGYISSAKKQFSQLTLSENQERYIHFLNTYEKIGGDIIEYTSKLKITDYTLFLKPLDIDMNSVQEFIYKGKYEQEDVTEEMSLAYQNFKEKNILRIFNKSNLA